MTHPTATYTGEPGGLAATGTNGTLHLREVDLIPEIGGIRITDPDTLRKLADHLTVMARQRAGYLADPDGYRAMVEAFPLDCPVERTTDGRTGVVKAGPHGWAHWTNTHAAHLVRVIWDDQDGAEGNSVPPGQLRHLNIAADATA